MSKEDTTIGIEPNLGGVLCYVPCCIGLIVSIVVAVVEKKSYFVRFHAFQSLVFHGAALVLSIGLWIFSFVLGFVPVVGWIISLALYGLFFLAMLGGTIFLMMKANAHEEYKLPRLGDLAVQFEEQVRQGR
jgi:uncharacterized membrane protein